MACSVGSLVHINFADVKRPKIEQVQLNLDAHGYSLCITDTKGSHADLTPDYAAIPQEMKQVAEFFGKEVLGEVSKQEILRDIPQIREKAGDRALLRAIHFMNENERVRQEAEALKQDHFSEFLELVKESGNSSYKYLQNVYISRYIRHQNLSVALAVSDMVWANREPAGAGQAVLRNDPHLFQRIWWKITGKQWKIYSVKAPARCSRSVNTVV